tara:strand:+ start:418 stop:717 length:300 start_codon:yes stop_codon:yes gene_type:complete
MSALQEIAQLRQRLEELEKQEQEQQLDDTLKKTSINHNFDIINSVILERTNKIKSNNYASKFGWVRTEHIKQNEYLEAIYNALKIMDQRIANLEAKNYT